MTSPSRSTTLKDKGHPLIMHAAARLREGRGARRRDRGRHLRAEARARRAALRRGPADLLARPIMPTRPFDESTLDVRSARGPYKVGRFEVNRYIEYERVKDWWGADLPVMPRQLQFRYACATSSIATATSRSRASPARTTCSARSSPRASGRRATIFPRSRTAASSARCARRDAVGRAGLVHQYPPRQVQGPRCARR